MRRIELKLEHLCDPMGGPYGSLSWTPLTIWTQPTSVRLEGGTTIANLDVYPNPSRDDLNVTFHIRGCTKS